MSHGIRIWNASSVLISDTDQKLVVYRGSFYTGTTAGSITIPDDTGEPCLISAMSANPTLSSWPARITVSGTTLSWSFTAGEAPANTLVHYGTKS